MKSLPRQPIRRASIASKVQELAKKFKHYVEKSMKEQPIELRTAAQRGLVPRKDEAAEHLAQARRHFESALNEAKGLEPANGPQTPLRKGEV
jgi:hypothetical protein